MTSTTARRPTNTKRVFLLGATGTIGRATAAALVARGHKVVGFVRPRTAKGDAQTAFLNPDVTWRFGDVTDAASLAQDGFRGEDFEAVVSCLASRTGAPKDAWAIDHRAHQLVLAAARQSGVAHMVLLSAICVQKPLLGFQQAKLAFEADLVASGLTYSIVRPTAFFKSLSGQVERVRQGKAFLVFGDGKMTACKPISDRDLAEYLVDCLTDASLHNRILPIGGPGPAITPYDQSAQLFALMGREPKLRRVPIALLDGIQRVLATLGRFSPTLADKAELTRIGRYYASESMLVLDPATGKYSAALTPSTGTETLFDYYKALLDGTAKVERGDHAVF